MYKDNSVLMQYNHQLSTIFVDINELLALTLRTRLIIGHSYLMRTLSLQNIILHYKNIIKFLSRGRWICVESNVKCFFFSLWIGTFICCIYWGIFCCPLKRSNVQLLKRIFLNNTFCCVEYSCSPKFFERKRNWP